MKLKHHPLQQRFALLFSLELVQSQTIQHDSLDVIQWKWLIANYSLDMIQGKNKLWLLLKCFCSVTNTMTSYLLKEKKFWLHEESGETCCSRGGRSQPGGLMRLMEVMCDGREHVSVWEAGRWRDGWIWIFALNDSYSEMNMMVYRKRDAAHHLTGSTWCLITRFH